MQRSKIQERSHKQYQPVEFRSNTPDVKSPARRLDAYHKPGSAPDVPMDPDVRAFTGIMGNLQDALAGGPRS